MTTNDLGFVLVTVALAVIAGGLSWMAIRVKRWLVRVWSELLDACAYGIR